MPNLHIKKASDAREQLRHDALKSLDIIERELSKLRAIAYKHQEGSARHMINHDNMRMMEHYTALIASHVLEYNH